MCCPCLFLFSFPDYPFARSDQPAQRRCTMIKLDICNMYGVDLVKPCHFTYHSFAKQQQPGMTWNRFQRWPWGLANRVLTSPNLVSWYTWGQLVLTVSQVIHQWSFHVECRLAVGSTPKFTLHTRDYGYMWLEEIYRSNSKQYRKGEVSQTVQRIQRQASSTLLLYRWNVLHITILDDSVALKVHSQQQDAIR